MSASKPLIVNSTLEEDILQIYPCNSLFSSSEMGWDGIHLGYYRLPPYSVPENSSRQHLIIIHPQIPPEMQLEQRFEGCLKTGYVQNGDIIIVPANVPHQASWDKQHSYIVLSLNPEKLIRSASLSDLDAVELLPCFQKSRSANSGYWTGTENRD